MRTKDAKKDFVSNILMARQVSRSQSAVQSITQVRAADGFDDFVVDVVSVVVVVVHLLLAVTAAFAAQATVQKTCLKT